MRTGAHSDPRAREPEPSAGGARARCDQSAMGPGPCGIHILFSMYAPGGNFISKSSDQVQVGVFGFDSRVLYFMAKASVRNNSSSCWLGGAGAGRGIGFDCRAL